MAYGFSVFWKPLGQALQDAEGKPLAACAGSAATLSTKLAGTWRANQQSALRDLATKAAELKRVFQKLDNFLKLFTGLINASHVIKRHLAMLFGQQFRL